MMNEPPADLDAVFDPFRGYEDVIQNAYGGNKEIWFDTLPVTTLARNAFYQGFITEFEMFRVTRGSFLIFMTGKMTALFDIPDHPKGPYGEIILTRRRLQLLCTKQMLGLSSGLTSFEPIADPEMAV